MCDMTRSYVLHNSFICVTCRIHMFDMTHSNGRHDSFKYECVRVCVCACATVFTRNDRSLLQKSPKRINETSLLQESPIQETLFFQGSFAKETYHWMYKHLHTHTRKATCCVLQCVEMCCSVFEECWSVLQCLAVSCSVLQCLAMSCSVLQFLAVCCAAC